MPDIKLSTEFEFLVPIDIPLVRLGKDFDGGYLIPQRSLKKSKNLVTLGLDTDWSFASDWKKLKPNSIVHAYDGTLDIESWSEDLQNAYYDFFDKQAKHFAENVTLDNIESILKRIGYNTFFTIDIEGSEYDILPAIAKSKKVTGFVVEFHALDMQNQRNKFVSLVKEIQGRYNIVHVHGNNHGGLCEDNLPHTLEITFCSKQLCDANEKRYSVHIPNLDMPNAAREEEYIIHFTKGG